MSDPNINPYFDKSQPDAQPSKAIIDVPPPQSVPVAVVGDTGMPAWMPLGALAAGFALVAIVLFGAFHQESAPPGQQQAAAPQQQQGAPAAQPQAQPQNPNSTTGTAPRQ